MKMVKTIIKTFKLPKDLKRTQVKRYARKLVMDIVNAVSLKLGNIPEMAENNYINPEIFEYMLQQIGFSQYVGHAAPALRGIEEAEEFVEIEKIEDVGGDLPLLASLLGKSEVDAMVSAYSDEQQ
jgi:hypothetical protein